MTPLKLIIIFCLSSIPTTPGFSAEVVVPIFIGKHKKNIEDTVAIKSVIEKFKQAIRQKDGPALNELFLYDDIFFQSAPSQIELDRTRAEKDPNFLKQPPTGRAQRFVKFISENSHELEERFYNVQITQDKELALVTFDFDFRVDGAVTNYGIEVWQMFKIGKDWRIATVVWSSTRPEG